MHWCCLLSCPSNWDHAQATGTLIHACEVNPQTPWLVNWSHDHELGAHACTWCWFSKSDVLITRAFTAGGKWNAAVESPNSQMAALHSRWPPCPQLPSLLQPWCRVCVQFRHSDQMAWYIKTFLWWAVILLLLRMLRGFTIPESVCHNHCIWTVLLWQYANRVPFMNWLYPIDLVNFVSWTVCLNLSWFAMSDHQWLRDQVKLAPHQWANTWSRRNRKMHGLLTCCGTSW